MFLNISKIFNPYILRYNFSPVKKQPFQKKYNSTQIFNQLLQFQCNDVVVKFILVQPYQKIIQKSRISLRSYKSLSIRCIHKDELYVKGSTYTCFDLNLKQLQILLNWDFEKGEQFLIQNGAQKCQIVLTKPGQIQKQIKNQAVEDKKKEKKQKKTTKSKDINPESESIQISLKTQKSQLSTKMSVQNFSILKAVLHQSFPLLSGIQSTYQIHLNSLVNRFQRGQIQEFQEYQTNNFIL